MAGCGGRRPLAPAKLAVVGHVDGAVVHGCAADGVAWILRAWAVERWSLDAGAPPRWVARVALDGPGLSPPAVGIGCAGERAAVLLADGQVVGVMGEAKVSSGLAGGAWPTPRAAPREWSMPLPDRRVLAGGPWGWGVRAGPGYVFWRGAPGDLRDATWDGTVLWAVGAGGLWRWRAGWPALAAVVLPAGLAGRPLSQVFRDGRLHWVRDDEGRGWPLHIKGGRAAVVGKVGQLPPQDPAQQVVLPGGRLSATLGQPDLRWQPDGGPAQVLAERPVHGLLPLGARLLVATEDGVRLWAGVPLAPIATVPLGGPVRRLIPLSEDTVLAVTAGQGLVRLRVERLPGPR